MRAKAPPAKCCTPGELKPMRKRTVSIKRVQVGTRKHTEAERKERGGAYFCGKECAHVVSLLLQAVCRSVCLSVNASHPSEHEHYTCSVPCA